jgi:hypothetical protein
MTRSGSFDLNERSPIGCYFENLENCTSVLNRTKKNIGSTEWLVLHGCWTACVLSSLGP